MTTVAPSTTGAIGEHWPPTETPPPPARGVPLWLLPFALLWSIVQPGRVGARLAATGSHKLLLPVLLAAVGGLLLSSADAGWADTFETTSLSERLRLPFVLVVERIRHDNISGWMLAALLGAVEASLWVLALPLFPLISAGERGWRAYLRMVRLLHWASIVLLPIGAAAAGGLWACIVINERPLRGDDLIGVALLIAALLWIEYALRLGSRYGGPAKGAVWEPRPARCVQCGYPITGLDADGRCPECGTDVARSLSSARPSPKWVQRHWFARPLAFLATVWAVNRDKRFFERLPIWRDRGAAVRFSAWVCYVMAALGAVNFAVIGALDARKGEEFRIALAAAFIAGCCILVGLRVLIGGFCLLGWRRAQSGTNVVATCYATAALLPVALGLLICGWSTAAAYGLDLMEYVEIPGVRPPWGQAPALGVLLAPLVVPLCCGVAILWRSKRGTRFASA